MSMVGKRVHYTKAFIQSMGYTPREARNVHTWSAVVVRDEPGARWLMVDDQEYDEPRAIARCHVEVNGIYRDTDAKGYVGIASSGKKAMSPWRT